MSTTNRSQDQDRLEGLEATGRVSPGEAAALREALEQHAERSPANDPAAEVELSKLNATARAFLSGAIDEPTLRKRGNRSLLLAAVLFNLVWYIVWALLRDDWSIYAFGCSTLLAAAWALALYWFLVVPTRNKLIRLRAEAGALRPLASADAHQCPTCLGEDFKVMGPDHWTMRHWVLNPGLAVNEVLLGQRTPKTLRSCSSCGGSSCACPHCNQSIDLMHWSRGNALGNWSGLRCPHCDGEIESLCNVFAWPFRAVGKLLSAPFRAGGAR